MFRFSPKRTAFDSTRRELLRVGGLTLGGLTLDSLLAARNAHGETSLRAGRAKSCIVLFLMGGPPQHSTWDCKPDAPAEVRGEIAPIATKTPGFQVGELMPNLAAVSDKLCVLRAMSTGDNAHSSSGYYMLTGRPHAPMNAENVNPGAPNDWPVLGAAIQRAAGARGELPAAVRAPMRIFNTDGSVWPGQDAGFLGRVNDPWLLACRPGDADFQIPEIHLPIEIAAERLSSRADLLERLNQRLADVERSGQVGTWSAQARRAYDLLAGKQAREALRLEAEPDAARDRYGRTQFGQTVLLARRLVEAGVRLVQANWYRGPDEPTNAPCWDSHAGEAKRLKDVLVPPWDQAMAALIADLDERGLLDETLVVCMSEFGRTPRINGAGGRDHWGPVFSVALAGGGIKGGMIHGASDRIGGYAKDGLVRPEDLTATILDRLGFSPEATFRDLQGRELRMTTGRPIEAILA